jgi:hypothetical protein
VHDQPAVSFVANQNVGAEAEQEIGDVELARDRDRLGQPLGRARVIEVIGGPADLECRVGCEHYVALDAGQLFFELYYSGQGLGHVGVFCD